MRIAVLTFLFVAAASVCFGDIVTNGGFENGTFSGWTLFPPDPSYTSVNSGLPHGGAYAAELGAPPDENASFSQLLPTTPGRTYTLIYWLQNDGGVPNNFSAWWDGLLIPGSQVVDDVDGFPYTGFVFAGLPAISNTASLRFSFGQGPAYFHLDDVSVSVPERPTRFFWIAILAPILAGRFRPRGGARLRPVE